MPYSLGSYPKTVLTCSTLTQGIQEQLLAVDGLMLVFLNISLDTAIKRASARAAQGDHWFHDEGLIRDQFESLQLPTECERVAVLHAENDLEILLAQVLVVASWSRLGRNGTAAS